jgi:hypothetical protein
MSGFEACELCGYRHNIAHRCPVYRFNAAAWVNVDDASMWPLPVPVHELPEMDVVCPHCRARSWRAENMDCCGGGRLQLPLADDVPAELSEVILSAHVRQHIRRQVWRCFVFLNNDDRQVQYGVWYGVCRAR